MLGGGRPAEQEKNSREIDLLALPPNLRNSSPDLERDEDRCAQQSGLQGEVNGHLSPPISP
ncbi:MAG: hypothetical protein JXB30_11825, partial [Anaerolineae bacterium]|nr:hypothetical protein [Anaerolineae bacterium]